MKSRAQLDAELDRLADMLPPWLQHLRHEAQFWPQFDALAVTQLADTELFGATREFAHTGALVAHFRGINAIYPYRHALPGDRGPVANGYAQGVAVINTADFINADIAED